MNGLLPSVEASQPLVPSGDTGGPAAPLGPAVGIPSQPAQIDPRDVRVLSSRILGKPATSVFDTGAPAIPDAPPGASIVPGRQDSFNARFGNWASPQASPAQNDAACEPMSGYPLPPSVSGLPDRSTASGDNMDDWLARWMPLLR